MVQGSAHSDSPLAVTHTRMRTHICENTGSEARAQQIYQKGAEDGIRSKWDELRRTADERVAQEQQRLAQHVQSLMDDFDSKHKR